METISEVLCKHGLGDVLWMVIMRECLDELQLARFTISNGVTNTLFCTPSFQKGLGYMRSTQE